MIYNTKQLLGVTFQNGHKEVYDLSGDKVYTYTSKEIAKRNSMGYYFTRVDTGEAWEYYYSGKPVQIRIIQTEYNL